MYVVEAKVLGMALPAYFFAFCGQPATVCRACHLFWLLYRLFGCLQKPLPRTPGRTRNHLVLHFSCHFVRIDVGVRLYFVFFEFVV